jgi:hypothetical protein
LTKRSKFGRRGGGSGVLSTAKGFASTQVIGATVAAGVAGTAAGWLGYAVGSSKMVEKISWLKSPIGSIVFQLAIGFGIFWGVRKLAPRYAFPAAIGVMLPVVSKAWTWVAGKVNINGLPSGNAPAALPSSTVVNVGTPAPIRIAR